MKANDLCPPHGRTTYKHLVQCPMAEHGHGDDRQAPQRGSEPEREGARHPPHAELNINLVDLQIFSSNRQVLCGLIATAICSRVTASCLFRRKVALIGVLHAAPLTCVQ
eukprot:scaffold642_cov41-Tisochrysis_lutea.AAC.1